MQDYDWQKIAPDVARLILGEPKIQKTNEWRWNNKGSLVFNLETGQFYDFEEGIGGGVKWLIEQHGKDVSEVLKQFGYDLALQTPKNSILNGSSPVASNVRSFSREQMVDLYRQSSVKVKYADNFMVLRHQGLPMKYAPFSLNPNGTWSMKRPEGLLPLYITNKYPEKPVIVNEGEKAMRGAERIWDYDVCCWHGGATGWNKTDWSPIFNRTVWIFPDNDKAGKKAANEIAEHLRANNCTNVKIITPPDDFAEKDDLWDAAERNYFDIFEGFETFVSKQKEKIPKGALRFERADQVISQIESPDWLIENCFEKQKLVTVFGDPKSGKSFIAIAMACAIAKGSDFYGHKATKAPVVYLAGEGVSGIRKRLGAYDQSVHGGSLAGVPLFLSNRGSRINEQEELEKLEAEINILQKDVGNIGLIILDTFQRCFSGDENSAQEVNKFIKAADQLIQTFNCTVLMVHHTGRGNKNRARGSSVLDASIDGEFIVERKGTKADNEDSMLVTMKQTKNKDGMGMAEKKFEFHEEVLTGDGYEVTSGLLIETDEQIKTSKEIENEVDKKIADKMYSLAMAIAKSDNCKPEDVWFTYSTFNSKHKGIYHLKNANDEPYEKYTVDNSLRRMLKQEIVEQNPIGNGYRLLDADFTRFNEGV
jgi:RecA-family ATPase